MIYIVDGTGPLFDDQYTLAMAGSHCSIIHQLNKGNSFYERGPSLFSALKSTGEIAEKVFRKVMEQEFPPALLAPGQRQSAKSPIFLVGHSRGGAAVVKVATMLDQQSIPVEAVFLFDAVDMTLFLDGAQTVPKNVGSCFHAIRNEGAEVVMQVETAALWKKCEQANGFADLQKEYRRVGSGPFEQFLLFRSAAQARQWPELSSATRAWHEKSVSLQRLKVAMRNSFGITKPTDGGVELSVPFGNCAMRCDPKCKWQMQAFACSHGAVGGTPWTNLGREIEDIDRAGAKRVWTWMASRMIQCGVNAGSGA